MFDFKKNSLDLIRLLSAIQVVIIHSNEHLHLHINKFFISVLSFFPGVPIFFVISGFLISASYERSNSLFSYVVNRFLRIYPALFFCFILSVLSVFVFSDITFSVGPFFKWMMAQLSFLQFYNPDFLRNYGVGVINGSLWTIPIELQFYCLIPILYLSIKKLRSRQVVLLLFLLIVVFGFLNQIYTLIYYPQKTMLTKLMGVSVFSYLYLFLLGVLLQKSQKFVAKYLSGNAILYLLIYLCVSVALAFLHINVQGNYLNPLSAIALGLLVISTAYSLPLKYNKKLRGNDISYGVYIYHMLIINVFIAHGEQGGGAALC